MAKKLEKYVGVYMEESFVEKMKELADADNRTLSNWIRTTLEKGVKDATKSDSPA